MGQIGSLEAVLTGQQKAITRLALGLSQLVRVTVAWLLWSPVPKMQRPGPIHGSPKIKDQGSLASRHYFLPSGFKPRCVCIGHCGHFSITCESAGSVIVTGPDKAQALYHCCCCYGCLHTNSCKGDMCPRGSSLPRPAERARPGLTGGVVLARPGSLAGH
jgi:hypothetical protein